MADLDTIRDGWDQAAREDAMGNILTDTQRAPDEFFAHGQAEIDQAMGRLDELGLRGERREMALDFGCGVGRLTQALGLEYDLAIGADVSAEMVTRAIRLNRRGLRVTYVNTGERLLDDFAPGQFDLIYSRITLQHMPQELQRGYIGEFIQLLAPEGVAMFQLPECPDSGHGCSWLSMYGTPRADVEAWVADAGGKVLGVENFGTEYVGHTSYRYTVGRA
jgi:SAM-dependent methyltransferase